MMITLCNGKGGTGKTTMTVLLAHALAEAGKKVAVHDLDPQGTATEWLTGLDNTKVELYKPAGSYNAIFTDTPPRLDTITPTLAACSVAVLVCSPSPADIWTTKATAEKVKAHLARKARLRILFNAVAPNTVLSRDLPEIAKRIGVPALQSTISRRQCYQHAAILGWSALDLSAKEEIFKAALEIVTEE